MELQLYRHLWGFGPANGPVLSAVAADGIYTGIECGLPEIADEGCFADRLQQHGLAFLAMVFTAGADPAAHLAALRRDLARARTLGATLVNVHAGSDRWPLAVAAAFLRDAVAVAGDMGLPVVHETHRGRILFNPRDAVELCTRVPGLELCADFSHFCVVCERLPADNELAPLIPRVRHIHARVGHAQGPQVNDPRAPEHQDVLAAHEAWWDRIWDSQQRRGQAVTTLTPEFGPPDYQPTLPWSRQPVSDLTAICSWQARRQLARYAARGQHAAGDAMAG